MGMRAPTLVIRTGAALMHGTYAEGVFRVAVMGRCSNPAWLADLG